MNQIRPKNLNLFTIRQPLPAIVSILHRISGFFLFLLIPFLIWSFKFSLTADGFATLTAWRQNFFVNLAIWIVLIPFIFHLLAGIRHLLMDLQIGVSLPAGRLSAALTLLFTVILVILAGFSLW